MAAVNQLLPQHQQLLFTWPIMSEIPYGYHNIPVHTRQLSDPPNTQLHISKDQSPNHSGRVSKEWIPFPEGVPGFFLFRVAANVEARNAAVSSANFEVSNQGGVFQVDDRRMNPVRASMHTVGIATSVSQQSHPATWIKGRASRLERDNQDLGLAMRPRWKPVSCRLRLGEGEDSRGIFHEQEDIEGYYVVGSGPIWAVADVEEAKGHQDSRARVSEAKLVLGKDDQRVRIFLFAPLRFIIDQTRLCDGQFTTVSDFEAATYRYKDGDDGLGGVLVRPSGRNQKSRRLPGYSFEIRTQKELLECLRFGGGRRYAVLADGTMKVHNED